MTLQNNFLWHAFDIEHHLDEVRGADWSAELIGFARSALKRTPIIPRSATSREADRDSIIQAAVVDGKRIKDGANWLYKMYRSEFLHLAAQATKQKLVCANNDLYGVNLNVQMGVDMRYECHVDSNPVQGMLYITTHNESTGGELIVGNSEKDKSVEEVLHNCVKIQPKRGLLVFFDARKHSHFVTALKAVDGIRVAAAMNFYTSDCPESRRPADLSSHLGLV